MRRVYSLSYLAFFLLAVCSALCAATPPIEITLLENAQDIAQIMRLQQNLTMSKDPKQLSSPARVTCLQANIAQFLPANVENPKPIYGCIFSDQVAMNAALLRPGLFVHTQAGMATDDQLFTSNLMNAVGGHDFSGAQLANYYKQAAISETSAEEHKTYKAIEKAFNHEVLQPILTRDKDNFIFFAVINTKKFRENLSHELLHAQYYNTPQIAKILEPVWQAVPKKDQETIIESLRAGGYDMDQHDLLLREFYSYFLQYNATQYLQNLAVLKPMAPLAKVYAPKITAALAKHNLEVLKIVK